MLSSWRVKNFKAWQDSGAIKLAPLTVFFGENSAGKSSLGQLLLALKQSAGANAAQAPLNFGEHHANHHTSHTLETELDLGSFAQNLHQGQLSTPLAFELQWRLAEPLTLPDVVGQTFGTGIDELGLAVTVLADASLQPQLYTISYTGYQEGEAQIKIAYDRAQPAELQVELFQLSHQYSIKLADAVAPERFYQLPQPQGAEASFVHVLAQQTEQLLANVQSLAALRAAPQRRYPWLGETPNSVGRAGQSVAAAMLAATAEQRYLQFAQGQGELPFSEGIAYWLEQMGVASDFSVRLAPDSTDEYQVLLKTHAQADEVNLADLGFGISQLLPVIVQAFYAQPHSTLWLEQPEIHLHSQVQAGLADMLIAATQAKQAGQDRHVQIIVESHSEHFLNRLQRRIAEGVIQHTDVALYFCSRTGAEAHIESLAVDTYGEIANWPANLFGDEMTDIAARAMAAVQRKRQQPD